MLLMIAGFVACRDNAIVERMSSEMPGLVETSNNLAMVRIECGILSGAYPHWDMVSCGPTLMSPHSPDERANIPSVAKCWDFLKAVLENIPVK